MAETNEDIGRLLGLMVHDLRNPTATLSANLSYLKSAELRVSPEEQQDVNEAIEDMSTGVAELMRGLDHLAWIGRWLSGVDVLLAADGDVGAALDLVVAKNRRQVTVTIGNVARPLPARGAGMVARLVDILLSSAERHARRGTVTLDARREGDFVAIEVRDPGSAIATELREEAFSLPGQIELKGRANGRYARFAGLFAIRIALESVGGRIEATGDNGSACFRILLPAR